MTAARGITWRDTLFIPIPLAFAGGMCYFIREGLLIGATTVLAADPDPGRLLELVEAERVNTWGSVAAIFQMMMDHENFERTDLSSLRFVVAGGGPIPIEMLRVWQQRGVHVAQGYGCTEASGECVTLLFPDEVADRIWSAGRPLANRDLRVVDDDGQPAATNEAGTILISGPMLMKGYLNQPEETAALLKDGWFNTGDMGSLDEEGYLTVLGRKKDMFISGGLNVYPAEIELTLTGALPGLEEVAVIGMASQRWGEVPLLVVPDIARIDLARLWELSSTHLADYKRPRYAVSHGGALPRNMNGKLVKMPLREMYQSGSKEIIELPRTS
jgi:fatty-acyl-CoA synthase